MKPRFLSSINEVSKQQWNDLVDGNYPFAKFEFLAALENSGCVGQNASTSTAWQPRHLVLESRSELVAAMPLYEKHDSYGEYVFDWQWANAFERYGRAYYPKLLTAVPFTPATGPRILTATDHSPEDYVSLACSAIQDLALKAGYSSWHLLFPEAELQKILSTSDKLIQREDVQFHWFNVNADNPNNSNKSDHNEKFQSFDQFLSTFRSSKRKQIRRERRKVAEQGIKVIRRVGAAITESDWANFYSCYKATYFKRSGHSGYLNKEFFDQIATTLADQCMLVSAYKDDHLIASSLFFFDDTRLYGRYWGALENYDCLHFEACYYQGIEFAIEQGLDCFDPGTQGEHKLLRGFQPTKTYSFHWISDAEFARAIDEHVEHERTHTDRYRSAAANHLPFRRNQQFDEK